MWPATLEILRCPRSGQRLSLEQPKYRGDRIHSGWLRASDGNHRYPIRDFIPRFVPESNYADSFGMQWNKFRRTQLDSFSGHPISANRFWKATGWRPEEIAGEWVLDAGCGAGRFAEVALQAGANVVALDYSSAVDACYANLGHYPNLHVVQGDIYALPLARSFFPLVYSLGVLQHTPDVKRAFASLPCVIRPGGRLCVDFYEKSWKCIFQVKYWLRPLTKLLPKDKLFAILTRIVPALLSLSRLVGRAPGIGTALRRLVPVVNYSPIYPLDDRQQAEWSLLDTFDWFAPKYDNPQSRRTVRQWLHQSDLEEIEVISVGHLVARGRVRDADRG